MSINHSLSSDENSELMRMINCFKDLIIHIRNSTVQNDLKKRNIEINLSDYNSTRWSSLFLSLEKVSKKRGSIFEYYNILASEYNKSNKIYIEKISRGEVAMKPKMTEFSIIMNRISDISWDYLVSLLKVLKICNEYNLELQNEHISLSMAHLGLKILINKSLISEEQEFSIVKTFIENLKKSFSSQFKETLSNRDVLLCCIIDCRTKYFIENKLVGFTGEEYNESKQHLQSQLNGLEMSNEPYEEEVYIKSKYDQYKIIEKDTVPSKIKNEYERWLVSDENISTRQTIYSI